MKATIQLELKLIHRYLKPVWMLVFFMVFVALWYWMESEGALLEQINMALLMTIFLLSIFGMYFQDFFWAGTVEPLFRFVYPTNLKEMILAKNLLLAGFCGCSLVPILALDLMLFSGTLTELLNAIVYLSTAMFIFVHFGNIITIRTRRLANEKTGFALLLRNALTFLIASLPYLLFNVLLGSYVVCLIFAAAMGLLWFYRSVPLAAQRLEKSKYEILEES